MRINQLNQKGGKVNVAAWILSALLIGILANNTDPYHKNQIIGWVGVSVLGALVGGLIGSLVFKVSLGSKLNLEVLVLATITSIALLTSTRIELYKKIEFLPLKKILSQIIQKFMQSERRIHKIGFNHI